MASQNEVIHASKETKLSKNDAVSDMNTRLAKVELAMARSKRSSRMLANALRSSREGERISARRARSLEHGGVCML